MEGDVASGAVGSAGQARASFAALGVPQRAVVVALAPQVDSLETLAASVKDACARQAVPARAHFDVQLALEELFVNVVQHGFEDGRPRGEVWLALWFEGAGETGADSSGTDAPRQAAPQASAPRQAALQASAPRQAAPQASAPRQAAPAALRIALSDPGMPYDPLGYRWQKVEAGLGEDNEVGGLGILLVRERMDEMSYRRLDGRNVVLLTKRLRAANG